MDSALKKILLVDMLYAYIVASLALMVPLYFVDIGIDIAEIGFIISLVPLAFVVMRLLFAGIADQVGTKTVEILESVAMIGAIVIYTLSRSAMAFAFAEFTEGVRDAGFWATVRTDVADANHKKGLGRSFALLIGLRQFADGLGRVSIGFPRSCRTRRRR